MILDLTMMNIAFIYEVTEQKFKEVMIGFNVSKIPGRYILYLTKLTAMAKFKSKNFKRFDGLNAACFIWANEKY